MRDEQGFADFASARSGVLRRQAYLLTGSAERAAALAERALADTGRRWTRLGGAVAAEEHARRAVAAGALRSRGSAPAVALTRVGTAAPTDDSDEAVWRALAGLPPRRRAVLVLRYDEGLDDIAVGARLGIPAATAAAEADAGLATLRSLLRRRGAPEDLLPTALAREPASTDAPPSTGAAGSADHPPAPTGEAPPSAPTGAAAGRGPAGSGPAGSGPAGSGPAGSGPAGSGTAGSGTAGSGTAGSGTAGSGPAGSGSAGALASGSAGVGAVPAGTGAGPAVAAVRRPTRADGPTGASAGPSAARPVRAAGGAPAGERGTGAGRVRWGLAAAVVAALGIGAAVVVPALGDDPAPAPPADPVPAAAPAGPGQLDWTARGPLAGDRELLRAALRTWVDGVPAAQRPTGASVLYAGAPDGARTVLLQGTDPSGQSWAAAVAADAGPLALRSAEPLGRAAPLVAVPAGDQVRLLTPAGPGAGLLAADPDGTLRPLPLDGDGLSEPVTPVAAGVRVVVTAAGTAAGSGTVLPGKLSAVTGDVELGAGTLDLGPATPTAAWYADGALLARRLGGPVTVAAAGPARTTTIRVGGRARRVDARAYEAVRGDVRHLATVVRIAGRPACVHTAEVGPAGAQPRTPPVLVSRCRPARASHGLLHVVAAAPVRTVRLTLPPAARGRPSRPVVLAGRAGDGLAALVPVLRLPAGPLRAEARGAGGTVLSRPTVPADRGPRT